MKLEVDGVPHVFSVMASWTRAMHLTAYWDRAYPDNAYPNTFSCVFKSTGERSGRDTPRLHFS